MSSVGNFVVDIQINVLLIKLLLLHLSCEGLPIVSLKGIRYVHPAHIRDLVFIELKAIWPSTAVQHAGILLCCQLGLDSRF